MNRRRKVAMIAAVVLGLGLGGASIAHSQVATPKPTAKPKVTPKPVKTAKPVATPKVAAAAAAKPVVTTPHHTG